MLAFTAMFLALAVFEYIAWLSPIKRTFQRLSERYFFICNPYYVPRALILALVIVLFRPTLWSPFTGGVNWLYSIGLGILFIFLIIKANPQRDGTSLREIHDRVKAMNCSDPKRLRMMLIYMFIYIALIEELIFRWFFAAILQSYIGWWVLLVEPLICVLWHYPIIITQPFMYTRNNRLNWQGLFGWSSQAFLFGLTFTIISVTTHNLIGAIMAHGFADMLSTLFQEEQV